MTTKSNPRPDPAWTPEELKKFYHECYPELYSRALGITKDEESAKDIVMRNFQKLLEGRSPIKPNKNACIQLRVWVTNDCKSYLTAKERSENRNEIFQEKYNTEPVPDVETQIIRTEDSEQLLKEIEKLSPACSMVLKLESEGLTIKEIATQLNKKESTVRALKTRGLKVLKKRLGGSDLFHLLSVFL
jgi:RNA polymerase sigma factor (sigma-70 family)